MKIRTPAPRVALVPLALLALGACVHTGDAPRPGIVDPIMSGWTADAPGVVRHIRVADLPAPEAGNDPEKSVAKPATVVPRPEGVLPNVPDGFDVQVLASGFDKPRTLRMAPNGDLFLSESGAGRVLVFRKGATGFAATPAVFAEGLDRPYGIVFVPASNPRYVYVAAANQVVRYPYRNGDTRASSSAQVIVADIPIKRHWTRDLAVSPDGQRLFVAIGSASNLGVASMADMSPAQIRAWERTHGRGAAWGEEENRAVVRTFDLEGRQVRNYATGLRNCSGMAIQPGSGALWCVVNERDHVGPYLVPDFMARVDDGAFFGWPWYYLGGREDPALVGKRPDLKSMVRTPEVLFQAHSSALALAFYDRDAFPAEYRGDAFVALHGSHSRPEMTGYKVVRVRMQGGQPAGAYEDFMTGFVRDNTTVWGRPAGVAVDHEGALLVSDDANGTVYRVTRK